ncbi:MAG: hypothetical protein ABIP93_20995, partial [Gemmatimonadaceae bacterium]
MRPAISLQNVLVGASALLLAGAQFAPHPDRSGPVLTAVASFVSARPVATVAGGESSTSIEIGSVTMAALEAFSSAVRPLSRPEALKDAFRSY